MLLPELEGLQRLTALSARGIIGIDDQCWWFGNEQLNEIFDDELEDIENSVVVNRMDRVVEFRWHIQPPSLLGSLYAIDEETGLVLVELGWHRTQSQSRESYQNADGDRRYEHIETMVSNLSYTRGGHTPRWLVGNVESSFNGT